MRRDDLYKLEVHQLRNQQDHVQTSLMHSPTFQFSKTGMDRNFVRFCCKHKSLMCMYL